MHNYNDTQKFVADFWKLVGLSFCSPFCIDILKMLIEAKPFSIITFLEEFSLLLIGASLLIKSYVTMVLKDERYVSKLPA